MRKRPIIAGLVLLIIIIGFSSVSAEQKSTTDVKKVCSGKKSCMIGIVNKIIDGDTLIVKNQKIRLSLTNTPEKNDVNFIKTIDFAKQICPVGSPVIVDQDDKQPVDRYERIVGKVTCSGKILNAELLYGGYAHILKQYCAKSEFANEPWAKKYGCGPTAEPSK